MKSFSFGTPEPQGNNWMEIWEEIEQNKGYFRRFCGADADEAMQRALLHTLTHYNPEKGSLKYYILALAKDIMRTNSKVFCVDFLEQITEENLESTQFEKSGTSRNIVKRVDDFSDELVEKIYMSQDRYDEVAELALLNMDMFTVLCESLKVKDSSTKYYSEAFVSSCLRLSRICENFNGICISIYEDYGSDMKKFMSLGIDKVGKWREADFTYIGMHKSKRVTLINDTGKKVDDADREKFRVKGILKEKQIVKVRYIELYERLLDLIDSRHTNQIKFIIGSKYVIRTLGGSLSIANPELYNIYDLVLMEILTNLLKDLNASLLNIGTECMYFLCNKTSSLDIPYRKIGGIEIDLSAEEVKVV